MPGPDVPLVLSPVLPALQAQSGLGRPEPGAKERESSARKQPRFGSRAFVRGEPCGSRDGRTVGRKAGGGSLAGGEKSADRQEQSSRPLSLPRRRSGRPARLTRGAAERGPLDRPQATDGGAEERQRPQRVVGHRGRPGGAEAAGGFLRPRTASQSRFPGSGRPLAFRPRQTGPNGR